MSETTSEATPLVEVEPNCSFEGCELHSLAKCRRCSLYYCLDHASEIDPMSFCINCATPQDIEIKEAPLVDKEGVTHQGRVLTPTGPLYVITSRLISDMNDDELKRFIEYHQRAVKEAENLVDYRKITLGQAEAEAFHRKVAFLSRQEDGTIKFKIPKESPTTAKQTRRRIDAKAKPDKVAAIMGALKGVSPEMLKQMLGSLTTEKKKVR